MPAFTSKLSDKEYTKILQDEDFGAASYKEVADAFMKNGVKQMYHAMVNKDDIMTMFKIEHLKIFWICRCHHVADDGSTSHEHLHALVQYQNKKTHKAFKHRLRIELDKDYIKKNLSKNSLPRSCSWSLKIHML